MAKNFHATLYLYLCRDVHPCYMVPRCPLPRCPPLLHGAALSTPAMSVPTFSTVPRCQVSRFQSPRQKLQTTAQPGLEQDDLYPYGNSGRQRLICKTHERNIATFFIGDSNIIVLRSSYKEMILVYYRACLAFIKYFCRKLFRYFVSLLYNVTYILLGFTHAIAFT